jgi:hypothetical protein
MHTHDLSLALDTDLFQEDGGSDEQNAAINCIVWRGGEQNVSGRRTAEWRTEVLVLVSSGGVRISFEEVEVIERVKAVRGLAIMAAYSGR